MYNKVYCVHCTLYSVLKFNLSEQYSDMYSNVFWSLLYLNSTVMYNNVYCVHCTVFWSLVYLNSVQQSEWVRILNVKESCVEWLAVYLYHLQGYPQIMRLQWQPTAFKGWHWVLTFNIVYKCYIKKNGKRRNKLTDSGNHYCDKTTVKFPLKSHALWVTLYILLRPESRRQGFVSYFSTHKRSVFFLIHSSYTDSFSFKNSTVRAFYVHSQYSMYTVN